MAYVGYYPETPWPWSVSLANRAEDSWEIEVVLEGEGVNVVYSNAIGLALDENDRPFVSVSLGHIPSGIVLLWNDGINWRQEAVDTGFSEGLAISLNQNGYPRLGYRWRNSAELGSIKYAWWGP